MLNERVECLWYFYGHTELWNPAHRNESYACIDFNFDRLEIKQTTKLGRLHARVNTHPRSVKYNFINVHLMLSIFKQLSRTKKQHQKKWIKENVDWNANSVGCTPPYANVQPQSKTIACLISSPRFFFLLCCRLIFRDLCVELVSLLRKNCPNEFVNWTLDPNEDWCVWTEMILFGMPWHSIVWHEVAWYSIEIERKATLGKLQTTKRENPKPV